MTIEIDNSGEMTIVFLLIITFLPQIYLFLILSLFGIGEIIEKIKKYFS
jgi:hypothetical protein